MSLNLRRDSITGATTAHYAKRSGNYWSVSWLPVLLTRTQAITAMTIAEIVQREELPAESKWWSFIDTWAGELGLTGADAVARCSDAELVVRDRGRAELAAAADTAARINGGAK